MTAEQLARKFKARADRVSIEFRKTAKDIAATSLRITKKVMTEEIYGLPVPTREHVKAEQRHKRAVKSGRIHKDTPFKFTATAKKGSADSKPAWKRTGALRRGEEPQFPNPYTVVIVNVMAYAKPRHEAGKPGRRKTRYPSHWRDQLREQIEPYLQDYYEATMRAILEAD